jgi:predicted nuclease of restriction endonuclease-like RecB superfamily
MLTGDLVRARLFQRNGALQIEWLDGANAHWQRTAAALIRLLQQQVNQPQEAWQRALEAYEAGRIDYMTIRGLAKVLSDEATFQPVTTPVDPTELRKRLFTRGPAFAAPDLLHSQTREKVLREAAVEYNITPGQVEHILYADRPAAYMLIDAGPAWTPTGLIARYNLELARAALYWADQMQVNIHSGFKDFWRYLKLFKLMFEATVIDHGYSITLDGPISPFVRATTRYGRQMAAFLPALLLCEGWRMWSTVRPPYFGRQLTYYLDHTTALVSHFKSSGEFDSRLEADFAKEFHEKFGDEREKWRLTREDEVILLGDTVMIPDFAFTHKKDGRRAILEIVGYWHPDYLERKVTKVRAANRHDLILLVYEGVNLGRERLQDVPSQVLYFKNKPVLKEVMALVEEVAI